MKKITKKHATEIVETIIHNKLTGFSWDMASELHKVVEHALKIHEETREVHEIYMACYEHEGTNVGFYTGRYHDVRARVSPKYVLTAIGIEEVPSGYERHRANLIAKKERLQAEVEEIEKRLASGKLDKNEN